MDERFEVAILSPGDYEDLVAEIRFADRLVAVISQEKGPEKPEIGLPIGVAYGMTSDVELHTVDLDSFLRAVAEARERLWKMRRPE